MERTKSFLYNISPPLIGLLLLAFQLPAQDELLKPEKMSERIYRHFEDALKYYTPDSLIYYRAGNDSQPYMKLIFKYNNRRQAVLEDRYKMNKHGYSLEQRTIKTFDPVTAKMRQADLRVIDKVYKDSVSTRTENMFIYDTAGNLLLSYTVDMIDGISMRANGDSLVYKYDKKGVPVSIKTYFFGYIGSEWIRDKEYNVEDADKDGNPGQITVSMVDKDDAVIPMRRYKSITWAKHCNSLDGIDTLAKEYTVALLYDGKWDDAYKRINFFNAQGKLDSTIVYNLNNGKTQPGNKDVYTYLGGLDFQSKLYYEYLDGHWKLAGGTRRTFSFDNGDNHYRLILNEEVYDIPWGEKEGSWKEGNKIVMN